MTKLSSLVHLRNLIDDPAVRPNFDTASKVMNEFIFYIQNHPVRLHDIEQGLVDSAGAVQSAYVKFLNNANDAREKCQAAINALEPSYYAASTRLYEQEMLFETNEYILNRRLRADDDSNIKLRARLLQMSDWRLPALIFRPGLETFIENLVPLDPLYIVDHNHELLQPALSKFTEEYRRRLRVYTVNDRVSDSLLSDLPFGQFGLIFAYNYFNYKPIEVIKRYLRECLTLLRPGGSIIMTYNDCDRDHGVELAEKSFMCYTPGSVIIDYAEDIALELVERYAGQGDLSWLEFKKRGNIESLRGGQTLARIEPK